jgi:ankyrin repeat protein
MICTSMERIENQGSGFAQLAKKILLWIVHARRLMSSAEIRHALAIQPKTRAIDLNYSPSFKQIMSVCAGLVTVDEESKTIRLVHYTTQKFFEKSGGKWFPNGQEQLCESCLTYLSYDVFDGYCENDEDFEKRLHDYPLYRYASQEWVHHADRNLSTEMTIHFLRDERRVQASSQALLAGEPWDYPSDYSQMIPKGMNGLHLASRYGLTAVIEHLLAVDETGKYDNDLRTPLSWAAQHGHAEVMNLLFDTAQVDVNSRDNSGLTPLSWAARHGYAEVMNLLFDTAQVDVNSRDNSGRTPLWWAARYGHAEAVKLLLDTAQVEVDLRDTEYGRTPLWWAAKAGSEYLLSILIHAGADHYAMDRSGLNPLDCTIFGHHKSAEDILVSAGADLEDVYGLGFLFTT